LRHLADACTIQIDTTNQCINRCSNCHHLCGHHEKPYFMTMDQFRRAADSLEGYPAIGKGIVGVIGGEPLLHNDFAEQCEYLRSMFPPEELGLWSCFPKGKEHYREDIVSTFGNIFINSHERNDILHCPTLVASGEVRGLEDWHRDYIVDKCWLQESWSPSIVGDRAYFCETAGCLGLLLGIDGGWAVEPGWWKRATKEFTDDINKHCHFCGVAMPLMKRISTEGIDDISPAMFERLKDTSPKIKAGKYQIHDLIPCNDNRQMATYKDVDYRNGIAKRYGMFLSQNDKKYLTPHLFKKWEKGE